MYKTLAITLFLGSYNLAASIYSHIQNMNIDSPNYYGSNDSNKSLYIEKINSPQSHFFFNDGTSYILLNKISISKGIKELYKGLNKYDAEAEKAERFFLDNQLEADKTDIVKQDLWFKMANGEQMHKVASKCVSFIDIYNAAFNLSFSEELIKYDHPLNVGKTLSEIISQLRRSKTKIFIPALVSAIEQLNKTKEISPVIYVDKLFSTFDLEEVIIFFTVLKMPDNLSFIPEKLTNTPHINITTDKNYTGIYRINLENYTNNIELQTTDNQKTTVKEIF